MFVMRLRGKLRRTTMRNVDDQWSVAKSNVNEHIILELMRLS